MRGSTVIITDVWHGIGDTPLVVTKAPVGSRQERDAVASEIAKLSTHVARLIEAEVIRRGWPVGQTLGSEPELRERFGASQAVLREAVRLVEHRHIARMRRGPRGGLIVCAPDVGPAIRAAITYLEFAMTSAADVLRARCLLEPVAAAAAARRITEDGVAELRRALTAVDCAHRFPERVGDPLHILLGRLSGNPVLQLFIEVLDRLTRRYIRLAQPRTEVEIQRTGQRAHQWHLDIVDAVIAGDAAHAEMGLLEHLEEITAWLRTQDALGEPRPEASPFAQLPASTMAEEVAGRIYDDIVVRALPVGEFLGAEAELMRNFGVSRSVLRAAVRLLEHHGVVRPRRGRLGGLTVTRPGPQASTDNARAYLLSRGVTLEHLQTVTTVIELGVLPDVVAGRTRPTVAPQLERLVAALSVTSSPEEIPSGSFHREIAELADNPVLSLFLRIIDNVAQHCGPPEPSLPSNAPSRTSTPDPRGAHRDILDAIVAGDEGLAVHRMRRHLDAVTWCRS